MRTILLTFGLIMLLALPATAGGPPPQTATATVTLTIDSYVDIYFDAGSSFDIDVSDGGTSSKYCATLSFVASANTAASISPEPTTPPTGAPGDWVNPGPSVDPVSISGGAAVNGLATVCVSSLSLADEPGDWTTGGEQIITITAP